MHSNTEIFDFKFVDRIGEKQKTEEFLSSSNNFLWIDGVHGVGKSFFIENYIIPTMANYFEYVIYVNKSSNEKSINYLSLLIEKMSEELPIPFETFISTHYSKWINSVEHVKNYIEDFQLLKKASLFANILVNINGLFVSKKNGEEHSASKVLFEYIQDILFNHSAYIILDNFSYCDQESFQVIEEMLIRVKGIKHLSFLLCTTTEEREKFRNLNILLCEKLPHTYIHMEKFDSAKYFQNIMMNKFHMTKWLNDNIENIYNLCEGIPDNLRNFVRQLYIDNGIKLQDDKFFIVKDKAKSLIYKKSIDFEPSKLLPNQQLIVQILALFGIPIPYDILQDFLMYINQEITPHSFQFKLICDKVLEIVESLLICQVITTQFYEGVEKITFKHDSIYNALYSYYHEERNAASVGYIHHLIYLYISSHVNQLKQYRYNEMDILEVIAAQSYNANEEDWQKYNKELSILFYKENKFYKCNAILSRFRKKCKHLDKSLILLMAEIFYEIAEYQSCIQELALLDENDLTNLEKAKYYVLYGKSESFCDSKKAIEKFTSALNLEMPFEQRCLIEYYCEMAFSEIKGKLEDAKEIFFKFYNNIDYRNSSVYASVLRSAVNLFDIEKAFFYLNKGLDIVKAKGNTLEEGKIINNLGFLYTRCEEYKKAYDYFVYACEKLENTKPFEMSYPLTNIVFIQMTEKNWEKALDYIEIASMYNKSDFIPYVLQTYKMICLLHLGEIDEALIIKEQLIESILKEKFADYKMIKKCKINCAYISYKIGDIESKESLLQDCWPFVKDTFAQNRYLNLCKKMNYQPNINNIKEYSSQYDLYDQIDFEPWIVTFGHD